MTWYSQDQLVSHDQLREEMKGHGGLALLGDYSDEEDAGADLDAFVAKSHVGRKKRSHQEFVENDVSDSSSDERDEQEPEMPQASLFLDYVDSEDGNDDEEDDERRILTSPEPEENDVDVSESSFAQKTPSPEAFPESPAEAIDTAPAPVPSRKIKRDDIDDMFNLLPPAKKSCPKDLRDKVKKYMQLKDQGQSINGKISTMKSLRNPYILEDLLVRHGLDELGSNFSMDRFNPHGFQSSDFHEALQATQHQMMTAQAKKGIVEFTNGSKAESSTLPGSAGEGGRRIRKDSRKNSNSRWDVAGVGGPIQATASCSSSQQQVIFPARSSSQPSISSRN